MSATKPDLNTAASPDIQTGASQETARLIATPEGKIVYANAAFETICGRSGITGRDLFEIVRFSNLDDAIGGTSLFGLRRKSGVDHLRSGLHYVTFLGDSPHSLALQFDWIDAADGRRFLVASVEDEALMASAGVLALVGADDRPNAAAQTPLSGEEELRLFLDMSHDATAVSWPDGTFVEINATFTQLLGYEISDLRGKRFIDLVHPEDRSHVLASMQGLLYAPGDEMLIDFETRVINANDRFLWMDWRHKRLCGRIYSVGRDITAAKLHEDTLRRHERQLSEAEAIAKMGRWHWQVGEDDVFWSEEIYRIFNTSPQYFKPTIHNVNALLHRRDVGRMIQAFQRAIIEQNDYDMDFRIMLPNGGTRFVRCEGRCELDAEGDVVALYGIMQDITETMLHERDLREAKEAAERAYAAKSQFLANMSHELRTPLNAIIGFSEMMQRQLLGPIGTAKYLEYIGGIRESGEHLLDLISDILNMSKIEAGKYDLDLEELNLAKTIRLAIHMMEGRALEAAIKISAEIENESLFIVADRRAVMQIMLNLLSNAVKFTESGGSVHVECLERQNYLSIKIHDTGIGIPANKLKTITRPFEQAASHYTRHHEGSGLGLAITKELVELHGGQLHIESTVGIGTIVTVRLPYDASQTRRDRGDQA